MFKRLSRPKRVRLIVSEIRRISPVTQQVYTSMQNGQYPKASELMEFRILSQKQFAAVYHPVKAGEISLAQLEGARNDRVALTELARASPSNPYPDVDFRPDALEAAQARAAERASESQDRGASAGD